jgi:hypothetical protein
MVKMTQILAGIGDEVIQDFSLIAAGRTVV